jgi:hypothetical protein
MNLGKREREILVRLRDAENSTSSAFLLRCTPAALWDLEFKKLVKPIGGAGSAAFPRHRDWQITDAGRDAIREAESK